MTDVGLWGGTGLFGLVAEKTGFAFLYGYWTMAMAVFLLLYTAGIVRGRAA